MNCSGEDDVSDFAVCLSIWPAIKSYCKWRKIPFSAERIELYLEMVRSISKYYLLCQIGGWSFLFIIYLVINGYHGHSNERALVSIFTGIVITHLLRNVIRKYGWLRLPAGKGLLQLFLVAALACIIAGIIRYLGNSFLSNVSQHPYFAQPRFIFANIIDSGIVIFTWTMIYTLYAYTRRSFKDNLERGHLEVRFREMKQRSDEFGLDVNSIISSLSEIQSSINQSPGRARDEITNFSKLLRRGYFKS